MKAKYNLPRGLLKTGIEVGHDHRPQSVHHAARLVQSLHTHTVGQLDTNTAILTLAQSTT